MNPPYKKQPLATIALLVLIVIHAQFRAHSSTIAVEFEPILEFELLDYREIAVGDENRTRLVGFNGDGSMVYYQNNVYIAYQHDIFVYSFPFDEQEPIRRLDVPHSDRTIWTYMHRVRDVGIRDELVLLIFDYQQWFSDPEDAVKTLFWVRDGGELLEPAGEQFQHYFEPGTFHPGGYFNLRMSKVLAARGKIFANIGVGPTELWVASDWEGPWIGLINDRWGESGSGGHFIVDPDDGLVVTGGMGFEALLGRGVLSETFTDWAEEFRLLTRKEIEFPSIIDNLPDYRAFTSIARNPLTKTVFAGGGGWLLRSTDAARSFDAVLYYPPSAHPHTQPSEPSVGLDPDDPSHFPLFRVIEFPTEHAHYMLVGGHEPYRYRESYINHFARGEVYFSRDDGRTWKRITEKLPKSDAILSPILFIENMPDGHLYLGRLQFRTPPDPEVDPFRPYEPYLAVYRVHLPDPAEAFHGMSLKPDGWRESDRMGWLYTAWYPWVWNPEQGMWSYALNTTEGFWLWDEEMGWTWSNESIFPYMFSEARDGYLYYMRGTSSPRWYFDYALDDWIRAM